MEKIVKLLFEAGSLKLVPRSGWFKIGIKEPESVAEHSFRTALIAFIITKIETSDENKAMRAAFFALIHDLHESRTLDLHKVARRYTSVDSERVRKEQLSILELDMEEDLKDYVNDADKLELLLQAKEYSEQISSAMIYVKELEFKTETAKELADIIRKSDHRWWLDFEVHM
ncbi:MAG TPA: HD domain-containing protein [Archaeoglobaceae archaeon]|nr:HD domain-containing protein [Archaeoglobaceae archaeon]